MMRREQLEYVPQQDMAADRKPNPINKQIEIGLLRSKTHGDQLMLYLTDSTTQEVETVLWKNASSSLKKAAKVWGCDPLGLIALYGNQVACDNDRLPLPPLSEAA